MQNIQSHFFLFIALRLSEDILSSTIDVLNHLSTNVSCCSETRDHSTNQEERALIGNQNDADYRSLHDGCHINVLLRQA